MIPSLLQIPSAVSDSKLHSVLPNNGKGDFQFDRSTGATRINKDGLIEEVGYFSSELVQNGNFSELGSEIIPDPNFDTDSTFYWAIATTGGTPRATKSYIDTFEGKFMRITYDLANGAAINRGSAIVSGKSYRVTFKAKGTANTAFASIGNNGDLGTVISNPTLTTSFQNYEFYITATQTNLRLYLSPSGVNIGDTLDIDNISVKQVDPNDRFELDSASYGQNKVTLTSVGGAMTYIKQTGLNLEANKTYLIKINATKLSGDTNLALGSDGTNNVSGSPIISTSGFKRYYFTPASDIAHIGIKRNFGGSGAVWEITSFSIVEVQGDRPRLSYDITNGVVEDKPHLLLEPSATNLVVNSNASFITNGTSISYNNITSPDGTQNGFKVQSTTTGTAVFVRTDNISFTDPVTFSAFVKYGNNQWLQFLDSNSSSHYFNFDVQNGVFGTSAGGTTNLKAVEFANGWYRVSGTFTGVSASASFRIYVNDRTDAAYGSAVSSAIGQYFYAFGWQVENLAFRTSYIPTAGTTITRAAETCNNSKPSVNSTEGVLYAEINIPENIPDNVNIAISDGTNTEIVKFIYLPSTSTFRGEIKGSSNTKEINDASFVLGSYSKVAVSYKTGEFKLYVNGSQIGSTITAHTLPTGLNEVAFDRGDGSVVFYGKVKGLAVYNEALSESQLMQLTGVTASSIYNNFVTRTASFTVEALNEVKKVIDNL